MTKNVEAAAPANVPTTTDEVKTSTTSNQSEKVAEMAQKEPKYDAINVLKAIHDEAVQDLFYKWKMEKVIELLQRTFDFIAGVNNDEKLSEYDLMYDWTDFANFYSAAFYTRENHIAVECSKEELEEN